MLWGSRAANADAAGAAERPLDRKRQIAAGDTDDGV